MCSVLRTFCPSPGAKLVPVSPVKVVNIVSDSHKDIDRVEPSRLA